MANNPFLEKNSTAGHGKIHLTLLPPNCPSFKSLSFTYPLKLVSSSPHKLEDADKSRDGSTTLGPDSVPLVFMLSYGGGLLPPDTIAVDITLDPYTRLTLTTQGSTKIFPSPPREPPVTSSGQQLPPHVATQDLDIKLLPFSALLLCPDPSQPFRDSHYSQTQIVQVSPGSSLGLLDWVTSGRPARGEIWDAGSWRGKNEVWLAPPDAGDEQSASRKLLLRDNVLLTGGSSGVGQTSLKVENMGIFGTFILYGPLFEKAGEFFTEEFAATPRIGGRDWGENDLPTNSSGITTSSKDTKAQRQEIEKQQHLAWRKTRLEREKKDGVVWTAAKVRGLVLVKFGAREVEGAREWLGLMCEKEGTIGAEFGPGGLMALR